MIMSRRGFLRFLAGAVLGTLIGAMSGRAKSLFVATEAVSGTETMYKIGDKVPKSGRY